MKVESFTPKGEEPTAPEAKAAKFDFAALLAVLKRPESLAVVAALTGIFFAFWPLLALLPAQWLDFDSYYAHGLLVVPAAAYIAWLKWPKLKDLPVQGSWFALAFLLPTLYVGMMASRTVMPLVLSVTLIAALAFSVWFIAGWKWMVGLAPAILFLILGLPILDRFIDTITFRLQLISTDTAELMLKAIGTRVLRLDPTVLQLDNFDLNIAEACSGLKTTIAVTASVIFFMLTTPLRWWAHAILAVIAVPLSVIVNGFRIALIGVVGNTNGSAAGIAFHDYSGYIALAICFLALWQLSKFLEDRGMKKSKEVAA
jgi:exosortase